MLAVLISWILNSIIYITLGCFFTQLYKVICNKQSQVPYSACDIFFIGFSITGLLITILSVWLPVNRWVFTGLLIFSLLYWLFNLRKLQEFISSARQKRSGLPKGEMWIYLLIITAIMLFAILPPLNYDSGLYHIQTIMWNESYPVVPGLANLHSRLGFDSNFLVMYPAFTMQFVFQQPVFAIHSLAMVFFLSYIISLVRNAKNTSILLGVVLVGVFFFLVYCRDFSSPSTDMLPNLLITYLLIKGLLNSESLKNNPLVYWVMPVYCITMKLSTAPVCLVCLPVLYHLIKKKDYRSLIFFIMTALLILIPWFVRNIILTGYLVFPFSAVDIFDFDWKVPMEYVVENQEVVYTWARIPGGDFFTVREMSMSQWIPIWFGNQNYMNKILFVSCLCSFISFVVLFFRRKKDAIDINFLYFWLVALAGFIFWFVTAPDFRFGYSFIFVMAIAPLLLVRIKSDYLIRKSKFVLLAVCTVLLATGAGFNFYKTPDVSVLSMFIKPNTVDYIKKEKQLSFGIRRLVDGTEINIPDCPACDQCYDQKLPCTPFVNDKLEMRGTNFRDGFRIKK